MSNVAVRSCRIPDHRLLRGRIVSNIVLFRVRKSYRLCFSLVVSKRLDGLCVRHDPTFLNECSCRAIRNILRNCELSQCLVWESVCNKRLRRVGVVTGVDGKRRTTDVVDSRFRLKCISMLPRSSYQCRACGFRFANVSDTLRARRAYTMIFDRVRRCVSRIYKKKPMT